MHRNASEPKTWPLQSRRKKSTVADEKDILISQAMQDLLLACEMDVDDASTKCAENDDDAGHCNELLDELELRKISILRRMAKNELIQHNFARRCVTSAGRQR